MTATDYITCNVWRLEEQAKRLRDLATKMQTEAESLERSAAYIQAANRKRLGIKESAEPGGSG